MLSCIAQEPFCPSLYVWKQTLVEVAHENRHSQTVAPAPLQQQWLQEEWDWTCLQRWKTSDNIMVSFKAATVKMNVQVVSCDKCQTKSMIVPPIPKYADRHDPYPVPSLIFYWNVIENIKTKTVLCQIRNLTVIRHRKSPCSICE
jgi:hypothetical protein